MPEFLKEILPFLQNHPFLLATLGMFSIFLYFTKTAWVDFIKKIKFNNIFKKEEINFKYKIKDLAKHDLFIELEHLKTNHYVDFQTHGKFDETKTKIFEDFLEIKIDTTKKNILKISQDANSEMSKVELKHLINSYFNISNLHLEEDLIEIFISKGLSRKNADIILDKFHEIRENSIERFERRINSIFACDFYETNFQIILATYEMVAFELDDILDNAIKTFEQINGAFIDLKYK